MKRFLTKGIVAAITVCVLLVSMIIPAFAADSGSIRFNPSTKSYETGKDITVVMTARFDNSVTNISGSLSFDKTLVKYKDVGNGLEKSNTTLIDGAVKIDKTITDKDKVQIVELVFTAIAPGRALFSFSLEGKKADGTVGTATSSYRVEIKGDPVSAPVEDDALTVKFNEKTYSIINDIAAIPELPKFKRTVTKYKGNDINTLSDEQEKYKLFYLSDPQEQKTQWFYLTENEKLEPLAYITVSDNIYIIEEPNEENSIPVGDWKPGKFTFTSLGVTVDCYESTKSIMSDFYIFKCYFDGKEMYYRYDKETEVLQRDPEFALTEAAPVETPVANTSYFSRLINISSEGKTLIFLCVLETILIVVLIILLIMKAKSKVAEDDISEE